MSLSRVKKPEAQRKSAYKNRELIKFTLSLILASLSINLMLVTDRTILGLYSLDSMNATSLGGNFVATVSFVFICVAEIATVFVGQYNGIKEYDKIARAPWQMIYLGFASFLFFIPLAVFCDCFNLFPKYLEEEGLLYTRILLYFGGFQIISIALSTFFIGRKQSYIVIFTFLIGNILNAIFDYVFVFGIEGVLNPLGAKGAAIATVLVGFVFNIVFASVFFNKNNREVYKTLDYTFRWSLFLKCLKVGLPISVGKFFNLLGWFCILACFINASKDIATIESFIMGIWMLFIFFADGASKALSALAANLIGENKLKVIQGLLRKFLKANYILCAIYSIPLVFFPEITIGFLSKAEGGISHLIPDLKFTLISLFTIILTDGIFYLYCGVLTAGGDTKFPTYLEIATLWGLVVIPVAVMYWTGNLTSIRPAYVLIPISGIINCSVIFVRYKKLLWYKQLVAKGAED
jgi:MATE family multidrug resistance protein